LKKMFARNISAKKAGTQRTLPPQPRAEEIAMSGLSRLALRRRKKISARLTLQRRGLII
jgi:hypothetical protein